MKTFSNEESLKELEKIIMLIKGGKEKWSDLVGFTSSFVEKRVRNILSTFDMSGNNPKKQDVEDIVQESYISLWKNFKKIKFKKRYESLILLKYLSVITYTKCMNFLRKKIPKDRHIISYQVQEDKTATEDEKNEGIDSEITDESEEEVDESEEEQIPGVKEGGGVKMIYHICKSILTKSEFFIIKMWNDHYTDKEIAERVAVKFPEEFKRTPPMKTITTRRRRAIKKVAKFFKVEV